MRVRSKRGVGTNCEPEEAGGQSVCRGWTERAQYKTARQWGNDPSPVKDRLVDRYRPRQGIFRHNIRQERQPGDPVEGKRRTLGCAGHEQMPWFQGIGSVKNGNRQHRKARNRRSHHEQPRSGHPVGEHSTENGHDNIRDADRSAQGGEPEGRSSQLEQKVALGTRHQLMPGTPH